MSIPVSIPELPAARAEFGAVGYLLSSGADGRPRAVSVVVTDQADVLALHVGPRTAANVAAQPLVSLLWPAVGSDGFSLIVDGEAEPSNQSEPGSNRVTLHIRPTSAVRHKNASAL
jgi:hypothetical protein